MVVSAVPLGEGGAVARLSCTAAPSSELALSQVCDWLHESFVPNGVCAKTRTLGPVVMLSSLCMM